VSLLRFIAEVADEPFVLDLGDAAARAPRERVVRHPAR
jgi:hypothetical protein